MNNYTVKTNHIQAFFNEGARTNLKDLQKFFTMDAIAMLILEQHLERDCNVIKPAVEKNFVKASDDLLEWVDVEYLEMVGSKFKCRILSNSFVTTFKYTK